MRQFDKLRQWMADLSEYGFYGVLWIIGLTILALFAAALFFLRAFGFEIFPPEK